MDYTKPVTFNTNPVTSNRKLRKTGKNLFWSLCCPVIFIVLAIIFSNTSGTGLFIISDNGYNNLVNITAMGRTLAMTIIAALALNTNLNSGRMDFSLGATGILSVLLASIILGVTTNGGTNALTPAYIFALLGLSIIIGMVLGFIHSIILILTKLPPIVISLGMCLVYEGIAKVISNSVGGGTVSLTPGPQTTSFFQEPIILIPLLVLVCLFMGAALCYTRYGYNKLALVYNQKISVDTGIDEILHCIVSFIIAGGLIAIYQVMSSCGTSSISISVNLGSSGTVFKNFLPIFIGGILAKYNDQIIGLFLGCLATTLLYSYGFDNASFINSTMSNLINGFSIFAVLVYMVDKMKFINWVKMKRYVRKEKYLNPEPEKGVSVQ